LVSATEKVEQQPVGQELDKAATMARTKATGAGSDIAARGEPFLWGLGGALSLGILMVFGFLVLILWNGVSTFYPKPIHEVRLKDLHVVVGEPWRSEKYRVNPGTLKGLSPEAQKQIESNGGFAGRTIYRTGNFDIYNDDFKWVSDYEVANITTPKNFYLIERMEWGPFLGKIESVDLNGRVIDGVTLSSAQLSNALKQAEERRERIKVLQKNKIGAVNYYLEQERLQLRKIALDKGENSPAYAKAQKRLEQKSKALEAEYETYAAEAGKIQAEDAKYTITLSEVGGVEKTIKLSDVVRLYPANDLTVWDKAKIYASRWYEYLTAEPREANTEGGVWPAIFGTFCMTVLMAVAVAPFGVMAALYLREYAKQGKMVSIVRICVNNLAGVPSIVYGVFGLGFFSYVMGGTIDQLFFSERLPNPTFGTGGLLWASLTLALLTVPVVIVSTEEALAAVPNSMREGSLACGASKWQTIRNIVLPRAMPGIMTGLILAMARGAGEVAPLMIVGVVKLAPALPIDRFFPYVHLERSFMHLGFHIYDLGFQSRNSEAAKPMVFVTTLLLITLVFIMNMVAIVIRNRLKRKFYVGHF